MFLSVSKRQNLFFEPFNNRIAQFTDWNLVHVVEQSALLEVGVDVAHAVWYLRAVVRLLGLFLVAEVDMQVGHSFVVNVKDFVLLAIPK